MTIESADKAELIPTCWAAMQLPGLQWGLCKYAQRMCWQQIRPRSNCWTSAEKAVKHTLQTLMMSARETSVCMEIRLAVGGTNQQQLGAVMADLGLGSNQGMRDFQLQESSGEGPAPCLRGNSRAVSFLQATWMPCVCHAVMGDEVLCSCIAAEPCK